MRWLADPPVDPAAARERAAQILARDEFAPPRRNPLQRALGAIGRFFARLLDKLFGSSGRRGGAGGGGASTVIAWIVVAAIVGLLIVLLVRAWRRRSVPAPDEGETIVVAVTSRTSAQMWRDEAAAHAEAGRWRDAVRCRYRAVEAELTDDGVLAGVPGDTTGGERRQVAAQLPPWGDRFAAAADAFDRAAYGPAPVDAEALAALAALDAELERR